MAESEIGEVDLFGDAVRLPNGRRGRPAHVYSQKIANKIMMLLALGWSQERVAAGCHLSVPTLRRHYFSILKTRSIQRDRMTAWQFEKLAEQAEKGNVGALREFQRMVEKNDAMLAAARMRDAQSAGQPQAPMGKKEAEMARAQTIVEQGASDDWGDDLKPGYEH